MTTIAWMLCALLAPPAAALPTGVRDLGVLHDQFIEAKEPAKKKQALDEIARTPPATLRDVKWLFDIFVRFPEPGVRNAIMSSLDRISTEDLQLEPAFLEYLKLPDSEAVVFGVNGALRLRSPRALPLITAIAKKRFHHKGPSDTPLLAERNQWWAHYEAVSALAQWPGAQSYALVKSKADEVPQVARLMALYLWKESLPQIVAWTKAGGSGAEKAQEALTAPVAPAMLRPTHAAMLKILLDMNADRELRHQIALKVGQCSTDDEVGGLLVEYETTKDPQTKLMLSAAIFASRSQRGIPLLKKFVREHKNPRSRMGALIQLKDMTPAAEYHPLVEWMAANDPDTENREEASKELKAAP